MREPATETYARRTVRKLKLSLDRQVQSTFVKEVFDQLRLEELEREEREEEEAEELEELEESQSLLTKVGQSSLFGRSTTAGGRFNPVRMILYAVLGLVGVGLAAVVHSIASGKVAPAPTIAMAGKQLSGALEFRMDGSGASGVAAAFEDASTKRAVVRAFAKSIAAQLGSVDAQDIEITGIRAGRRLQKLEQRLRASQLAQSPALHRARLRVNGSTQAADWAAERIWKRARPSGRRLGQGLALSVQYVISVRGTTDVDTVAGAVTDLDPSSTATSLTTELHTVPGLKSVSVNSMATPAPPTRSATPRVAPTSLPNAAPIAAPLGPQRPTQTTPSVSSAPPSAAETAAAETAAAEKAAAEKAAAEPAGASLKKKVAFEAPPRPDLAGLPDGVLQSIGAVEARGVRIQIKN